MLTLFFESPTCDHIYFHLSDEDASGHHSKSGPNPNNASSISCHEMEQIFQQPLLLEELPEKINDLTDQNNGKEKITVVIPGEQVTTKIVQAPKSSKRHINQAIPYLLEDDLATPVEDLHFALGKPNEEGLLLCAVISSELLESYLEKLSVVNIHPSILIPDYWLLPNSESTEHAEHHQRHLIRLADNTGMVLPIDAPEELLKIVLEKQAVPSATPSSETPDEPQALPEEEVQTSTPSFCLNQQPLNLLQGDYAPLAAKTSNITFKPIAIAAGICITVFMVYFVAMGWYFNQQSEKLNEEAKATYHQWFPNESRILNIRRQMTAHINNSGNQQQDGLFFELTNTISQAVSSENEKATIRHIRFDRNDATLQLELQAKSMGYAHSLQSKIQETGFAAEVLSANSNDEGVIARLRLSLASSNKTSVSN